MKKKYAISDIHGCKKSFEALLDKISFSSEDELYLLGDYVDRGPDSKGVLDIIFDLQQKDYNVHCLRGNHEQMLLNELGEDTPTAWLLHGGIQTLNSFDVPAVTDIPKKYLEFLDSLPYYFEVDNYILVHAGLNFKVKNPLEEQVSMMWIRDWFEDVNYAWLGERIVVHGHTPVKQSTIIHHLKHLDKIQTIDIDNGCCFDREGMRHLTAFDMTERAVVFQKNVEGKEAV